MSQEYNRYLAREQARDLGCAECGYHRMGAHHPKIRCPRTGRCGDCGNDWPCPEHAPPTKWRVFMTYGAFTEPEKGVNFIFVRMPEGRTPWTKKIVPAIKKLVHPWRDDKSMTKTRWDVDGEPEGGSFWASKKARKFEWNGVELVEVKS